MNIALAPRQDASPQRCKHGVHLQSPCGLCQGTHKAGGVPTPSQANKQPRVNPYKLNAGLRRLGFGEDAPHNFRLKAIHDVPFSEMKYIPGS